MWKKLDGIGTQPDPASKNAPDLASLGDALVQSLRDDESENDNIAAVSPNIPAEPTRSPLPSPSLKMYTEAVSEFTTNASAFLEHLPLLNKARAAFEQAMTASAEMRKALDTGEENLRALMSQLEQGLGFQGDKSLPEKKTSAPANLEKMTGTADSGRRPTRWP